MTDSEPLEWCGKTTEPPKDWDDIIHRMIFDTEDDAKSACAQVGKNYLDYVWIQNPETKQFFTGGELATDTH